VSIDVVICVVSLLVLGIANTISLHFAHRCIELSNERHSAAERREDLTWSQIAALRAKLDLHIKDSDRAIAKLQSDLRSGQ